MPRRAGTFGGVAVPAVLCVDVEPDTRSIAMPRPDQRLAGFEALVASVPELREVLTRATGRPATFTWFLRMDPQMALAYGSARHIADRYRDELDRLRGDGDEVGLHTHAYRWDDAVGWVQDFADAEHLAHCTRVALDAYADAFGVPCRAHRHGDRCTSTALAGLLAHAGVRVDLTVEPGAPAVAGLDPDEHTCGVIPHVPAQRSAPWIAEQTSARSAAAATGAAGCDDGGELLMLPLTSSVRFDEPPGPPAAPGVPVSTLVPWAPPAVFAARLDARLTDPHLTHLALAIRSDLPLHRDEWAWFRANIALLADVSAGLDLTWVTASEARDALVAEARRGDGAGWPAGAQGAATALGATAAGLERGAVAAERSLAQERALRSLETTGLTADLHRVEARRVELEGAVDRLEAERSRLAAELAELRATRWWRAHERLLPLLRRLPLRR
jgi:hypothetical protein